MRTIELLSPAGSVPAMVAAVQCGANAVYLGAGDFNARKSADNFGGELDSAVGYCHGRGARVYVTLNTMVREDELDRLESTIGEICAAGADGVIVQDFGVARAVHQMAPGLHLHASTQMAVHNAQGVDFLVKNGFTRVVLAREMQYAEIARCAGLGAELEVFVHGALCVACSGQCLLSSMIGGRSGNRGLCAQPCRMRYRMGAHDGYLLSTRDLCGLEGLEALLQAGADSIKIEGRLKRPEYVAEATSVYRSALDALARGEKIDLERDRARLAQMFNRGGFTRGYGFGVADTELMFSGQPNHMGVEIGLCRADGRVQLTSAVDAGDVLALRRAGSSDTPVHAETASGGEIALRGARRGDRLIRLVSRAQMLTAQASFGEHMNFPVDFHLTLRVGAPAALTVTDGVHEICVSGEAVQSAAKRPADPARIRAQLEKTSDTPFAMRDYRAEIDENAFIAVSQLNALRREALDKLFEARMGGPVPCMPLKRPVPAPQSRALPRIDAESAEPELLCRALAAGAERAVFAPDDLRLPALDAALERLPERFYLAVPAVIPQDSLDKLNCWALAHADRIPGVLLSNIGQLGLKWPGERIGDAPLNIANSLSVAALRDWGLEEYTPSVELKCAQIAAPDMPRNLIVYGRLPLMFLRHCPLRAAEGLKGAHADCRRCDHAAPGDRLNARVLTDRTQAAFPLHRIAEDEGCVIQLKNSAVLMLLRKASALPAAAAWRLKLEETDDVEALIRLHLAARGGADVRSDPALQCFETIPTTTGHYFRGAE